MSDNTSHPLIELLNLSDCGLLTNEGNLTKFTYLKVALEADGIPLIPIGDVEVDLNGTIDSTGSFWDLQTELLFMLILGYARSATEGLVSALNELARGDILELVIVGDLYSGDYEFSNLDLWRSNFNSDEFALRAVYSKWRNVIDYIDHEGIIAKMML